MMQLEPKGCSHDTISGAQSISAAAEHLECPRSSTGLIGKQAATTIRDAIRPCCSTCRAG